MENGMFALDEIQSVQIPRYSTGYIYLDVIYGRSEINGRYQYGMPHGKISLWAASPGVGKTRLATDVAITINSEGKKVLVFQNEVTPSEYKGWIKRPVKDPAKFLVSNYTSLEDQIEAMQKCRPDIVICDSVNMIEDYENPKEIRRIMETYKKVTQEVGCHVIFIGHLNKEMNVKGNNDLEYLIDVNCKLYPHESATGVFVLEVGKNRYGKKGGWVAFKHFDAGIMYLCGSEDPKTQELQRKNNL